LKKERLKGHEQANCYILRSDNRIQLISYSTKVLDYDVIEKTVYCTGLYSMTTRRQIGWYMSQFIPHLNYHDIKHAYNKNTSLYVGFIKGGVK